MFDVSYILLHCIMLYVKKEHFIFNKMNKESVPPTPALFKPRLDPQKEVLFIKSIVFLHSSSFPDMTTIRHDTDNPCQPAHNERRYRRLFENSVMQAKAKARAKAIAALSSSYWLGFYWHFLNPVIVLLLLSCFYRDLLKPVELLYQLTVAIQRGNVCYSETCLSHSDNLTNDHICTSPWCWQVLSGYSSSYSK